LLRVSKPNNTRDSLRASLCLPWLRVGPWPPKPPFPCSNESKLRVARRADVP
jgi:hypothetical protein